MSPIISIIIPIYNVERYLHRCICSVVSQTFNEWELILVDDGSPDKCGAICDNFASTNNKIKVIHQKNYGVSVARNTGIAKATGSYLYFLDPDDYIPNHALSSLYSIAQQEKADIVMGGYDRIEADGTIHRDYSDWPIHMSTEDIQTALLKDDIPNFSWGRLYKRNLWNGLRFPINCVMEDLYLIPYVFYKASKIVLTNQSLYYYSHENIDSIMTGLNDKYIRLHYCRFLAWHEHEKLAKTHSPAYIEYCSQKAIHAAVRAILLNSEKGHISPSEISTLKDYLIEHRTIRVPLLSAIGRSLILRDYKRLSSFAGYMQRVIAEYQQRRRVRRMTRYRNNDLHH